MDNENPGFRLLKEAFEKFKNKLGNNDLQGRVIRSAAAGGKALVDRGLQEFPKTFVEQVSKDVYDMFSSQEVADSVSSIVTSYDDEKVTRMLEGLVEKLKDRDTALDLAKKVKSLLQKMSPEDIELQLDGLISKNQTVHFYFTAAFGMIKPLLNDIKNSSDEEAADLISNIGDYIPPEMIGQLVSRLTSEVSPEFVSKQIENVTGALPSPKTVADIAHDVGAAASGHLDRVSKSATPQEAADIMRELGQAARDIANDRLGKDRKQKKPSSGKKGKTFDI